MSLPGISGEPGKGDCGSIRALASQSTARGTAMRARAGNARTAISSLAGVTADFADSLRTRIMGLTTRFDDGAQGCDDIAAILNDYADSLDRIKADAATALQQAQDDYDHIFVRREQALNAASETVVGWAVGWDQTLPAWLYLDDPGYLRRWESAIEAYHGSAAVFNALTGRREDLDNRIAGRLRGVSLFAAITDKGGVPVGAGRITAVDAWAGSLDGITAESLQGLGDPDVIRQVWDSLGEDRRNKMIEESPMIIGNLNGLPIGDRIKANKINVENEATRVEKEASDLRARLNDPSYWEGKHERVAAQEKKALMDQIAAADKVAANYRAMLNQEVTWVDENGEFHVDKGSRVVVFDPKNEAIASYHGPIDPKTRDVPSWIKNVVVHVPGTGTNMQSFGGPDGFGKNLYGAAGGDTAVFVWAGGPLPQTIPEATSPSFSQGLAPKLRDFRDGILVPGGADVVVTGHSYGGAVVGLAEQAGLRADRVLYIAGAGMGDGVHGVQDFPNTSNVPHYSMQSRNEIVVGLIQDLPMHGQSPIRDQSGVIRLETGFTEAGNPNSPDIESTGPREAHSSPMYPGSTSFENIVGVVTGSTVELFAEDHVDVYGRSVVVTDGIDHRDYKPNLVDVK